MLMFLSAAVAVTLALAPVPDEGVLGLWSGGIGDPDLRQGRWSPSYVVFTSLEDGELHGEVEGTDWNEVGGRIDGDAITIFARRDDESWTLTGRIEDGVMTGTAVEAGGRREEFLLVHEPFHDDGSLALADGMYAAGPGHRIVLRKSKHLILDDFGTDEVRVLYSTGPDRLVAGPAYTMPQPVEFELALQRDAGGAVTGFTLDRGEGDVLTATRMAELSTEEFAYEAPDGVTIRGSLRLPPGEGPHPGVVWVHGSGRQTRTGAGGWSLFLADLGFAVLAIDKRGVGESDGSYEMPDGGHDNRPHMERRSGDVRAAVAALAARDDVRGDRIGLVGASQAGWVIPMAAADNEAVAFTIVISGGATALSVENVFSEWSDELASGVDGADLEQVLDRTRRYRPRDPDFREAFIAMRCPGLWLYGGKDRSNPSQICAELIEEIAAEHDKDFRVHLWPDGNHGLWVARFGGAGEYGSLSRRVEGLHARTSEWLSSQGLLSEASVTADETDVRR